MGFGSDFRVKYLMRETQRKVTERLREEGLKNPLQLRVFDDDAGDGEMWDKGGLTFTTMSGVKAGSGDGAWYVKEKWTDPISKKESMAKPILMIEGTFGNETGVVGDGQKTKLSHVNELGGRGILAGILMPKIAEYYTNGKKEKSATKPVHVKNGSWMESMVAACISHSKRVGKELMFLDAYNKKQLENLVYALARNQIVNDNESLKSLQKEIREIMCEMEFYVDKWWTSFYLKARRGKKPLVVLDFCRNNNKVKKNWVIKIHSDDIKAFGITTGKNPKAKQRHRNGHRLLGNTLELSMLTEKNCYLLLPRWNKDDLKKLKDGQGDDKGQKEFKNFQKTRGISILTYDDINFGADVKLKKEFKRIRKKGIDLDEKLSDIDAKKLDGCCNKLKEGLYSGTYKIKK